MYGDWATCTATCGSGVRTGTKIILNPILLIHKGARSAPLGCCAAVVGAKGRVTVARPTASGRPPQAVTRTLAAASCWAGIEGVGHRRVGRPSDSEEGPPSPPARWASSLRSSTHPTIFNLH